jgi:iron complex outermembrane recepter protein
MRFSSAMPTLAMLVMLAGVTSTFAGDSSSQGRVTSIPAPVTETAGMYSLANVGDQSAVLGWLEPTHNGRAFRFSLLKDGRWTAPGTVVEGQDLFSNWADHPSITGGPDGVLIAQWPVINPGPTPKGSYNNSLRIAVSRDRGATWREVFADGKDNIHSYSGFVTLLPGADGLRAVYLTPPRPISSDPMNHTMTLSHVAVTASGKVTGPTVVDTDTCSCCPTAFAQTSAGPIAAYRDHEAGEIRDISVVRFVDGRWTAPRPVHRDGWNIHGCPTNGPELAAQGDRVAVAWFTAAEGIPRMKVAFSGDAGATFGKPAIVSGVSPVGRGAMVMLPDRSVAVAWIESVTDGKGELRLRRVTAEGALGDSLTIGLASPGRSSGMPHMIRVGNHLLIAWRGDRLTTVSVPITALGPATEDAAFGGVTISETVSVTGNGAGVTLDTLSAAGSRLGLTARETPATVNVMTFAEAQERGLGTTTEALARVPGVSAANLPATFATSIRGFTAAAISTLYDGTRSTTSSMVMRNFDSWNFERIEVLKGPASVLYGEGALAGAVNFVTKRPDFSRRRSEALVSFGSLPNGRAAFGTTGPFGSGERAAYRADVVFSSSAGYIDDNDTRAVNVSGAVDLKLTPAATLSLSADHFRDDYNTGYWGTPLVSPSIAREPTDVVSDSRGLVLDKSLREINYEANDAILRSHSTWLRARLDWRLSSAWRLVNETYGYDALRDWRNFDTLGFDASRALVTRTPTSITHDHQFYGNRLTLASDQRFGHRNRRNRLSVGVEANRNRFFMPRRFGTASTIDPFSPVRGTFPAEISANFPGAGNFIDASTTLNLASVFAEDAFSVLPGVTLVAGGRYDHFDVERRNEDRNTSLTDVYDHTFEPLSGRIGVVVDVARATQLFAQFTSAVAPVSTVPIISRTNAGFDLTTGRSWEGGVKSTLAEGRVEFTAAAFRVRQDDILTRDPNNANITIQGGTQSSTGAEISVSANLMASLRVDGNVTFMKAQFDELIEAGGLDRTGNVPANVPERTTGIWATYRFSQWPLSLSAGVRRQGRYFANNANTARVSGYTIVDAQASWRVGPGDVTLRGKNLTDTFYVEWAPTANQMLIGMPRVVEMAYQFTF